MPIRVRDVADVNIGHAPRLGMVGHDEQDDVVQGIVLMRYGGETPQTLEGVHARVERIRNLHLLPPGMDLVPYYDRGRLVNLTTHTVIENLLVGMSLVILTLLLFLGNTRAALITALNIPLALLIAFIGMVSTGTSANLLSLGAVDFGIVVDSTVIMMENIFRHLGAHGKGIDGGAHPRRARARSAAPMTFSTLIIGIAFLPLFTMTGVSGVDLRADGATYAFAIGGAILMALTLTPVLAVQFIPPKAEEKEIALMRVLHRLYNPFFDAALRRPRRAVVRRSRPDPRLRRALSPPRRRVHAQARGGQLLDSRHAPHVDLARAVGALHDAHAPDPPRLPGRRGRPVHRRDPHRARQDRRDGRLAARPARRRDRRRAVQQHRVLRAATAVRRVAARRHQGDR